MRNGQSIADWKVAPLAADPVVVFNTRSLEKVFLSAPSLEMFPSGRLVVAVDQLGAEVKNLPGKKGKNPHFNHWIQGRIFVSSDQGKTWAGTHSYPFGHARLFRDGQTLYLLGDAGSLQISRSNDGGTTWSEPDDLTSKMEGGDCFVASPANVLRSNGWIYMAVMKVADFSYKGDFGSVMSMCVMKAREGTNLLNPKSWTWSQPTPAFRDMVPQESMDQFGVPFFKVPNAGRNENIGKGRWANRIGWYDPFLFQIRDAQHYWYDPSGKTIHVLASAETHRSNLALLSHLKEEQDGVLRAGWVTVPSGKTMRWLPLPGGHLKFHAQYDEESHLYWLVSQQSRDSMTRAEKLTDERTGLPCEEYSRLQLHFSSNLVDWCFAGFIDAGANPREARREPCMAIRGNQLCIVACSGDAASRSVQDTVRITFHSIPNFRELIY
ncbi:MAG: exo-alpha-sialidase [Lentisphaerota bacterium]